MRLTPRVAGFRSEYPAGFELECMAGFVDTRTRGAQGTDHGQHADRKQAAQITVWMIWLLRILDAPTAPTSKARAVEEPYTVPMAFRSPVVRIAAILCGIVCVFGSELLSVSTGHRL
jgi:hypothetical protein